MKYLKILSIEDYRNFSKKECIFCFLIYSFVPLIPGLILINVHINTYLILVSFSMLVLCMGIASMVFIYKYSDESDIHSKIHLGATYQLRVKLLFRFLPGLALLFIIFNYFIGNLKLGLLLGFSFFIPSLTIFRTDIFNDSNSIIGNEIVFGYNPSSNMIISVCLGLLGYYISFISSSFIGMCIIFFIQLSLLYPDFVNKYFFVDIKLKEYYLLFISFIIIIFLILVILLEDNINFNFNISFYSILRWVFFVVLTVIVSKWYFNKQK